MIWKDEFRRTVGIGIVHFISVPGAQKGGGLSRAESELAGMRPAALPLPAVNL